MAERQQVGRARARGRATAQSAPAPRRPGGDLEPAAQAAPSVAPAQPRSAGDGQPGGQLPQRGRAARGQGPVQSHASEPVKDLAARMTAIALGDDANRGGGRGAFRGRNEMQIVRSRPPQVTNKQGTSGEPAKLVCNYFAITSRPDFAVYHYHVEFNPDVEGGRTRRALLHDHDKMLGKTYIFDGMALFIVRRLETDEMDLFSTRRSDDAKIRIHLKLTRELHQTDPVVLQIFNIQMRKNMQHLNFALVGRHYYDKENASEVANHNMELWPGFTTAIHEHENKSILMCCDLTFKVLRLDSVYNQMEQFYNQNSSAYKQLASQALIGSVVLTKYNNKTYRIDDILWDKTPEDKFTLKDGSQIDYMKYYREHWNITVRYPTQPLLVSLPKKREAAMGAGPVMLIPELCIMTGLSEETRSNFTIMKEIAAHTRKGPGQRIDILRAFMQRTQGNAQVQADLAGWDHSYSRDLVQLPGRHLLSEKIIMDAGRKIFTYDRKTADWSNPIKGSVFFQPIPLKNWVLICTSRDSRFARDFLNTIQRVGPPMGISIDHPHVVELPNDRTDQYVQALQNNVQRGVNMAICVVPAPRKDRYDAIKKYCCIDNPVPSQVIVTRTISKPGMLMSVCTKIAIQLNCKLGGSAWAVELPAMKAAMVIGYDSYHDSSMKGRSAGALCCSTDFHMTKYFSRVSFQTSHQEMLNGFRTDLTAAFRHYHSVNGCLPDRVFIYRDGVGEGQLQQVLDYELAQVKECCKEIGDYTPQMAFIVVTKRINTRIMEPQRHEVVNPLPGTVVDSVITRPEWYDFFLVSQSVRQGTVSPTHYNIIHDTSGLKPDHLQRLSYKLTHLYYNWPGTIRVPAPCMYAHKLAFLAGQSLHASHSSELSDKLFFL